MTRRPAGAGGVLRDEAHVFSSGPQLLRQLLESVGWRDFITQRGDRVQPRSFEEFATTPLLHGLGADVAMIRRVVGDDPVTLDLLDQAMQRTHGVRKLRTDAPELHTRVLAGVAVAAIEDRGGPWPVVVVFDLACGRTAPGLGHLAHRGLGGRRGRCSRGPSLVRPNTCGGRQHSYRRTWRPP